MDWKIGTCLGNRGLKFGCYGGSTRGGFLLTSPAYGEACRPSPLPTSRIHGRIQAVIHSCSTTHVTYLPVVLQIAWDSKSPIGSPPRDLYN